jgi:hypothetical protein
MNILKPCRSCAQGSSFSSDTSDDDGESSPVSSEITLPNGVTFDRYCGGLLL